MIPKVIIPVFGFKGVLPDILSLYKEYLDEAQVLVVNDKPGTFLHMFANNHAIFLNNEVNGDLKYTYSHYLKYTESCDYVITNEHDVVPTSAALYACISAYQQLSEVMKIASVSCVYRWNGKECYPSHPNWHKDKRFDIGPEYGRATLVGAQGVPFGFAVWSPEALALIDNDRLPKVWKLDSEFGVLLNEAGYHHVRLLDYTAYHYDCGINSWKQ